MNPHDPTADLMAGFRPWSDDLADPRWREVREAISSDEASSVRFEQQCRGDQQLRSALHQVEVPAGLCDQLLVRLAQEADLIATEANKTATIRTNPNVSRRTWLLGAAATAVSIVAASGVSLWMLRTKPAEQAISREELAREVAQWLAAYHSLQSSKQWSTTWQARELTARPLNHIKTNPRRWHLLACPPDSSAVVYDLRGPGRSTAVLFVVRMNRVYQLPSLPVAGGNLSLSSNKFASAAWQAGNLIYVLVVDEDGVSLDDFLQPSRVA